MCHGKARNKHARKSKKQTNTRRKDKQSTEKQETNTRNTGKKGKASNKHWGHSSYRISFCVRFFKGWSAAVCDNANQARDRELVRVSYLFGGLIGGLCLRSSHPYLPQRAEASPRHGTMTQNLRRIYSQHVSVFANDPFRWKVFTEITGTESTQTARKKKKSRVPFSPSRKKKKHSIFSIRTLAQASAALRLARRSAAERSSCALPRTP